MRVASRRCWEQLRAVVGHALKTGGPTYVGLIGVATREKYRTENEATHMKIHRRRVG